MSTNTSSNSSHHGSLDPSDYCKLGTCPLELANFTYVPSLGGNVAYLAIFAALLIPNVYLGIRYKTWGYTVGMVCGLVLEVIGYAGRVQLHFNPFPFDPFLEYLICLTIAPAFLTASIYLCLGRIVVVYGEGISRIAPRLYTIIFVCCDLISLILQAAGGAISATADDRDTSDMGVNVMIAGLSAQVVSLFLFVVLCAEFALRVRKNTARVNEHFVSLYTSKMWKLFLLSLCIAVLTIFVRCVFRVAELQDGFNGALFNDEVASMILEGPMIIVASLAMTVFHPGMVFRGRWAESSWSLRNQKGTNAPPTYGKIELQEASSG